MKKFYILSFILILAVMNTTAQEGPPTSPVFNEKAITFAEFPGLEFKISEPYLMYQKWDTEHTGTPSLALACEFTNKSDDNISAIYFIAKLYDNEGGTLFHGTVGMAPMLMEPNPGSVFGPGYKGVATSFISRDQKHYGKTGKLEFSINDLKVASASLNDKPVFSDDWINFEGNAGLEFQLSEPYVLLDDMSGNELFAIAMNFRNLSKKPVKAMYFDVKIFDEIGVMIEQEIQEHNRKYIPEPENFMDPNFPKGYEGIDKKFFIRGDMSLFDSFRSIKIELKSIE